MRILIVSDPWYPQANSAVQTLDLTALQPIALGPNVHVISHKIWLS